MRGVDSLKNLCKEVRDGAKCDVVYVSGNLVAVATEWCDHCHMGCYLIC